MSDGCGFGDLGHFPCDLKKVCCCFSCLFLWESVSSCGEWRERCCLGVSVGCSKLSDRSAYHIPCQSAWFELQLISFLGRKGCWFKHLEPCQPGQRPRWCSEFLAQAWHSSHHGRDPEGVPSFWPRSGPVLVMGGT